MSQKHPCATPAFGASILVVDDDPDIQEVLTDRLDALGYRICAASTGRAGLALLEAEGPQLVLLDVVLPDMDGLDVLTAMRTRAPEVTVVMITAFDRRKHDEEAGLDGRGGSEPFGSISPRGIGSNHRRLGGR